VSGNQLVTPKCGFPFALAASDQNGVARLVGEAIERALGYHIASAQLADARARIG
jgi:hypothetical protein